MIIIPNRISFQMERLVKEELERWDSNTSLSKAEGNDKNGKIDEEDKDDKVRKENQVESDGNVIIVTSGQEAQSDEISSSENRKPNAESRAESRAENRADSKNRPASRLSSQGSGE